MEPEETTLFDRAKAKAMMQESGNGPLADANTWYEQHGGRWLATEASDLISFVKLGNLQTPSKAAEAAAAVSSAVPSILVPDLLHRLAARRHRIGAMTLEAAPPNEKAEDFIQKAKASFKSRYGDDWKKVLYATAWKRFGKTS